MNTLHRPQRLSARLRTLPRVLLLAAVLAMAGCAPPPLLQPLAPATLDQRITQRQQITARFGDQKRVFQAVLNAAPDKLTLIGLSAVGQRLFTLSWNGRKIRMQSPIKGIEDLDPKRILADLQLAYWPLPALRSALPADLELAQYGTARVLWHDGQLLWFASSDTPERWHSRVVIYNVRLDYRLTIRPLGLSQNAGETP